MQYLADGSLEHERNSCASGSSVDTPGKRKSLIQRRLLLPIPIGSVHAKRSENLYLTRTYVDMRTQLELMPHGNLCLKGTYQSPTTLQNRNLLLPAAPAVAVNGWSVAKASRRDTLTRIIAVEIDLFSRHAFDACMVKQRGQQNARSDSTS